MANYLCVLYIGVVLLINRCRLTFVFSSQRQLYTLTLEVYEEAINTRKEKRRQQLEEKNRQSKENCNSNGSDYVNDENDLNICNGANYHSLEMKTIENNKSILLSVGDISTAKQASPLCNGSNKEHGVDSSAAGTLGGDDAAKQCNGTVDQECLTAISSKVNYDSDDRCGNVNTNTNGKLSDDGYKNVSVTSTIKKPGSICV